MKNRTFTPGFIFIVALIIIGSLFRLIPHLPNFTPIAAMALFGGAYLNKKALAFIIPLAAMFLSDLIIGLHSLMFAVYFSFIITVFIGFAIKKNINVLTVISASLISSVLFFLITNLAVWYSSPFYTQNITGLMQCYTLAIPFFRIELFGDLVFNSAFFGIYYLACRKYSVLAKV